MRLQAHTASVTILTDRRRSHFCARRRNTLPGAGIATERASLEGGQWDEWTLRAQSGL